MSIIVGFVPTPVGEAAVRAAIGEAKLRNEDLLIVNSVREGALVDKSVASPEDIERIKQSTVDAGIKARILEPSTATTSPRRSWSWPRGMTSR